MATRAKELSDLGNLKLDVTANGIDVVGVASNFKSESYNILNVQTDTDDSGSSDDGIFKITNGSAATTKAEFRWDESEDLVHVSYGDHGRHISIASDGNVGIGTSSVDPDLKLHVDGTNGYPASSGTTPVGHIAIRAKSTSSSHGANIGVANASPWGTWIQAQDANNLATNYPLLLNPNGGNVGIGTDNPAVELDLRGNMRLDGSAGTDRSIYFRNQGAVGGSIKSDKDLSLWAGNGSGTTTRYLTIIESGNVGIGNDDPSSKLEVGNGTSTFVTLRNASTGDISSGYNIVSGSTTTTSLYGNADEGWTTLLSGGSLNFRVNNASSGFNPMGIDTSGRVTTPYQPSASVKLNSDNSQCGQNVTVGPSGDLGTALATIKFETLVSNTGNHYSTSTGKFTCPVAGKYFVTFNSNVNMGNATANTYPEIHVNNALYIRAYDSNDYNQGSWVQQSITAIIPCSANDYIEIKLRCNTGSAWADSDTQYTQASFMLL